MRKNVSEGVDMPASFYSSPRCPVITRKLAYHSHRVYVLVSLQVSVGASDFTQSEAGTPPLVLQRFEALQHSHLRQASQGCDTTRKSVVHRMGITILDRFYSVFVEGLGNGTPECYKGAAASQLPQPGVREVYVQGVGSSCQSMLSCNPIE